MNWCQLRPDLKQQETSEIAFTFDLEHSIRELDNCLEWDDIIIVKTPRVQAGDTSLVDDGDVTVESKTKAVVLGALEGGPNILGSHARAQLKLADPASHLKQQSNRLFDVLLLFARVGLLYESPGVLGRPRPVRRIIELDHVFLLDNNSLFDGLVLNPTFVVGLQLEEDVLVAFRFVSVPAYTKELGSL